MPEQSKLKVFLCHASQDKPIVRDLYQRLSAEGWIDPWLDEEKLLPGQDWDMEIEKAVEFVDVVIVLISKTSVTKEGYIQKEIRNVLDIALEKPDGTLFVIPLRLDECEVPRKIRKWHYVDYYPLEKLESSYKKLIESMKLRAKGKDIDVNVPGLYITDTNAKDNPMDFGAGDVRRLPVYFLLECSDSMRGEPIKEVEQGIRLIHNELMGDPQSVEQINISVITYSTYAQQITPLMPITSFILPPLTAGGINNLGNALRVLCDCINKDVVETTAAKKGDYMTRVFWITAHEPTDNWLDGLTYLRKNTRKFSGLVALGVGNEIDVAVLRQFTSEVLLMTEITASKIFAYFKWISQPVTTISQPIHAMISPPLPPPPIGFQITLDFVQSDIQRMPVYLLLECDNTMSGAPITAMEQAVQLLHNELLEQPQATGAVCLSVITYSTYAQQVIPLKPLTNFIPPALSTHGVRNVGNAFRVLGDCIHNEMIRNTGNKNSDYKALIFWITGGSPTDDWEAGSKYFKERTGELSGSIIALGVGDSVNTGVLRKITPNVLLMTDVTPESLRKYFRWESQPFQVIL